MAWTANTAYNILNMLQGAVSGGTGGEAAFANMSIAGKTGTSSDNWNRWFVGMTPYYVAAVWTGYDSPESMGFYGNPAAQIWKKVMEPVHSGLEYKAFPWPSIGGDTQIFGDLTEDLEEQENPSPSPTPTDETVSTTPTQAPVTTPDMNGSGGAQVTTPTDLAPPNPDTPVEPAA